MKMISEGAEQGDLLDLVDPVLTIDQYRSKMGDDQDIVVVCYRVSDQEPAEDLVNFFEKGYDFVLDADISSGPVDDLKFLVFVEMTRHPDVPKNILKMTQELCNLTQQEITDWRFSYKSQIRKHDLTVKNIQNIVPLTPEDYESSSDSAPLEELKIAAGLPVDSGGERNEFTEKLKLAAGIRIK